MLLVTLSWQGNPGAAELVDDACQADRRGTVNTRATDLERALVFHGSAISSSSEDAAMTASSSAPKALDARLILDAGRLAVEASPTDDALAEEGGKCAVNRVAAGGGQNLRQGGDGEATDIVARGAAVARLERGGGDRGIDRGVAALRPELEEVARGSPRVAERR